MITTEIYDPTIIFSWNSLREQQLHINSFNRVPLKFLTFACRKFSKYDSEEGQVTDSDINLFLFRFLRDPGSEKIRQIERDRVILSTVKLENRRKK